MGNYPLNFLINPGGYMTENDYKITSDTKSHYWTSQAKSSTQTFHLYINEDGSVQSGSASEGYVSDESTSWSKWEGYYVRCVIRR